MNRRELLKRASRLLGLAALIPFIPTKEIQAEVEFENEPNYHQIMTNEYDKEEILVGFYYLE